METKIKMKRRGGYTVMPNAILRDTSLTLQSKGLFCMMASFPEDWDFSIAGLASVAGTGKDAIRSALKNLEEAGYLLREQSHSSHGHFSGNVYVLYDECIAPLSGFPTTVKPTTVKPSPDNPTQLSKDVTKERKNNPPIPQEVLDTVEQYAAEDAELKDAIIGLLLNRVALRKPVKTNRAVNGILRELDKLGKSRVEKLAMLDKATVSNWLTVYALKSGASGPACTPPGRVQPRVGDYEV